jgi:glycine/D-amino acid oxidase-like deaminating enzyme
MKENCAVGIVGGGPIGLFCAMALTEPALGQKGLKGERLVIFDPGDRRKTAGMSASAFVDFDWTTGVRRVIQWQKGSRVFYDLMRATPGAGVSYGPIYVFRQEQRVLEPGERHLDPSQLPAGFPYGTAAATFRINPPVFLGWMRTQLERRGVQFRQLEIKNFAQAHGECGAKVIVNASGVGARVLCDDPQVFPVRGHCAVIRRGPGRSF